MNSVPGGIRIRVMPVVAGRLPDASDVSVEVQQADGSWVPLRGVVSAKIAVKGGAMINSWLHVELAELDITAPPDVVERRQVSA